MLKVPERVEAFNRRFIATELLEVFKYLDGQEVMNPAVVATQVCGFKKVKKLHVRGLPDNFQGCFDDLFPVSRQGSPPFFRTLLSLRSSALEIWLR